MRAKNGGGSRAALTVSFERRNQFTKSGTTFEKIQFELVWLRNGNSGHTKEVLPMMNRSWIGRGTLESCRAFVPNAMFLITNFAWRLTQTPYKRRSKKNGSGIFSLRSRYDNCLKLSWPGRWCFCRCFFLSALRRRLVVLGCGRRSTTWLPTRLAIGALACFSCASHCAGRPARRRRTAWLKQSGGLPMFRTPALVFTRACWRRSSKSLIFESSSATRLVLSTTSRTRDRTFAQLARRWAARFWRRRRRTERGWHRPPRFS